MSIPENDLKRRALLGDRQAQEECSRLGVALPCPCCGSLMEKRDGWFYHSREACFLGICCFRATDVKRIGLWNRRPAPPVGRCKDCDCYWPNAEQCGHSWETVAENDFCSKFKPKEAPNG